MSHKNNHEIFQEEMAKQTDYLDHQYNKPKAPETDGHFVEKRNAPDHKNTPAHSTPVSMMELNEHGSNTAKRLKDGHKRGRRK